MNWKKATNPVTLERIIAGVCYLSAGLLGLLYIVLSKSKGQSMFFRFHFIQSMMIGVIFFLLNLTSTATFQILHGILSLMNNPALADQIISVIGLVIEYTMKGGLLLCLYGMIWAFMGKYAEIPVISPLVRQNLRT
jgi:uncharacterized membrane protein